jgi:hypothetical protein
MNVHIKASPLTLSAVPPRHLTLGTLRATTFTIKIVKRPREFPYKYRNISAYMRKSRTFSCNNVRDIGGNSSTFGRVHVCVGSSQMWFLSAYCVIISILTVRCIQKDWGMKWEIQQRAGGAQIWHLIFSLIVVSI